MKLKDVAENMLLGNLSSLITPLLTLALVALFGALGLSNLFDPSSPLFAPTATVAALILLIVVSFMTTMVGLGRKLERENNELKVKNANLVEVEDALKAELQTYRQKEREAEARREGMDTQKLLSGVLDRARGFDAMLRGDGPKE